MEELTEYEREILSLFKDVTNEAEDDKCIHTLSCYRWDVEDAIMGYMQSGHVRGSHRHDEGPALQAGGSRGSGDESRPNSRASPVGREPRAPEEGGPQWLLVAARCLLAPVRLMAYTMLSPFRLGCAVIVMVSRPILTVLGIQGLLLAIKELAWPQPVVRHHESPQAFEVRFRARYGPQHPPFLHCSFSEALRKAAQELKPLMVYVHKDNDLASDTFARGVLCQEAFVQKVAENYLVLAASEGSVEGYSVAKNVVDCTVFPLLAVGLSVDDKFEVLQKVTGGGLGGVLEVVDVATGTAEHCLSVLRCEREERIRNQLLREEQDMEFETSLTLDRNKECLRQMQNNWREQEEAKRQEEERREREKEEARIQQRRKEFDALSLEPNENDSNVTTIVIKLPNGGRLKRRFRESDTVQCIYSYVGGHPSTVSIVPAGFVLATPYPKALLTDMAATLQYTGLCPTAVVYMEDGQDEDTARSAGEEDVSQ